MHGPIASVAALTAQPLAALPPYGCGVPLAGSERLAGWQYLRYVFYGVRSPGLSFRGAKRRGNLAVLGRIIGYFRRKRNCLPEIATSAVGLLAMTIQGSGVVRRYRYAVQFPCAWRSVSAAAGRSENFPLSIFNYPLAARPVTTYIWQPISHSP